MNRVLDISVPIRPGNRGGRDSFNWEDVKADKYKECYLGHSLHTARPTFNQPRPNMLWYVKPDAGGPVDLARIKEEEEALMAEALGLAPKKNHLNQRPLDKADFETLTKRGATERGTYDDGERVEGVGFRPSYSHELVGGVIQQVETKLEGNDEEERGWLEKSLKATKTAAAAGSGPSAAGAAEQEKKHKKHKEHKDKKDKKDKKHKEKKEKKSHRTDEATHPGHSRHRSRSPAGDRRPAQDERERRRSPSPRRAESSRRRRSASPVDRRRRRSASPRDSDRTRR